MPLPLSWSLRGVIVHLDAVMPTHRLTLTETLNGEQTLFKVKDSV